MSSKAPTALITGATDGHGRRVALDLAARGWTVVVHGRDRARGEAAVRDAGRGAQLALADLASLEGVRALAHDVTARVQGVDVLINNAGVIRARREVSADGIELTFAVNYLAHVVLTQALLELAPPSRIVNVASLAAAPLEPADPLLEHGYEPYRAYGQSKLAQVMWTFDLAQQLDPTRTTVNALHPATLMDTTMVRESFGRILTSVEDGAAATERLVLDADLEGVTGRFFDGQSEARAHPSAYDPEARRYLRDLTTRLIG
jgi:NAD(P)-dependent dehydrogenase (short-subunit alcohol dehydrogenase family)